MDADGNQRCICNAVNVCSVFIHWLCQTTITTPHITLRVSVNNMVRHYAVRGCKGDNCDLSAYRGGGREGTEGGEKGVTVGIKWRGCLDQFILEKHSKGWKRRGCIHHPERGAIYSVINKIICARGWYKLNYLIIMIIFLLCNSYLFNPNQILSGFLFVF